MKEDLLFYNEYEKFYDMAKKSYTFQLYCKEAFGEDFSQDGFSNMKQINRILEYVPAVSDSRILDIGCGNGKMLKYLQDKTNSFIYGFDYSENAIETAKTNCEKAEFKVYTMEEAVYSENTFDLITSMDTMYFTKDMTQFVSKIFKWLKGDGVFFVGYQEGDIMEKTENGDTTILAQA
ncbi:MAG: methyltransferase domain-containing protein [Clostridiales bacterium]|nr:methyltransferase domain-containing protein [Clostridiales bacterium]